MVEPVSDGVLSREEEYSLIDRTIDGDTDAFGRLVETYQARVFATVYNMTGNHEDANDITQDTFIKAHKALKSFKKNSGLFTWLYRIAVNRTINFLNTRKKRQFLSFNHEDYDPESNSEIIQLISDKTPRKDIDISELREKLNTAIQELSEKHRFVVIMHDIQGMSHDEISEILGCSNGTVRSRLFYARQQLQAILSEYLQ